VLFHEKEPLVLKYKNACALNEKTMGGTKIEFRTCKLRGYEAYKSQISCQKIKLKRKGDYTVFK
jgi:hypothetical protein